jgi:hypothetical protein
MESQTELKAANGRPLITAVVIVILGFIEMFILFSGQSHG